jgi:hypothetical protein
MGLGVLSRPAGCWSWLRPRGVSAPRGTVPVSCWSWLRGHLRGAGVGSGHPCGGTETGSNRADARRKSGNRYALAGVGSACMAVEGLNSGNGEHTKIQQKRKVVPDRRSSRLSPAGGVISSCRGLWVLGLPGKPWLK